jgi:AraC-like DNA-binding protein
MSTTWPPITKLDVSTAGIAVYPPGAILSTRCINDFEFIWIIEGSCTAYYDDQPIQAPPGTVLLRRPGMKDRYDWAPEHRTIHAYFHFDLELPATGWPRFASWPLAHTLQTDDVLRPLFRYVLHVNPQPEPIRSTLVRPTVDLMLRSFVSGRLGLLTEPHTELPEPVTKALDFIRQVVFYERPRNIRLAELAKAAHITPEHLCRLFRKSLNLAPLECVRLARLQFAASLLNRSHLTVKEIADATGFATPYHFSRVFSETYGLSPKKFRESAASGAPVRANPIVRNLRLDLPKPAAAKS